MADISDFDRTLPQRFPIHLPPTPLEATPLPAPKALLLKPTATGVQSDESAERSARNSIAKSGNSDSIPGFEMLEELGRGGMGVVYRARQRALNRVVALKMVLDGSSTESTDLLRFLAEAEAIAAVEHPNVVRVYECGRAGERPYLAMEYLPGGSLIRLLKAGGRLSPMIGAIFVEKIARGVQAVHDVGIIHRDLKPGNVLLDTNFEPKVTDFGLAKRAGHQDLTKSGTVMGTPAYMAPEQARGGTKFVGPSADIYAIGVILYECITGRRPFESDDAIALIRMVIDDSPPKPRQIVSQISRDLERICLKCLEKAPHERYPSAAALADDLHRFAVGEPISVRPATPVEQAFKWAKRYPTRAGLIGLSIIAGLLMGISISVFGLWQRAESAKADVEVALGVAESAQSQAEAARFEAVEARAKVELALTAETVAKTNEAKLKEELASLNYARTVDLAHREVKEGNTARALQLLDQCAPSQRHWEWQYVRGLCQNQQQNISVGETGILSVAFHPNGRHLAVPQPDKIVICDTLTGTIFKELPTKPKFYKSVLYDSTGTNLWGLDVTGHLTCWNCTTWDVRFHVKAHEEMGRGMVTSRSGKRLLTFGLDSEPILWDVERKEKIHSLAGGHFSTIVFAEFFVDEKRIVTSDIEGNTIVWDLVTGKKLPVVLFPKLPKFSKVIIAMSPSGKRLLSVTGSSTQPILRDANDGTEILRLRGSHEMINAIQFLSETEAISAGHDGILRRWDLKTGEEIQRYIGHVKPIFGLDICRIDGKDRIATGDLGGKVMIWNADRHTGVTFLQDEIQLDRPLAGQVVKASPDGTQYLTGRTNMANTMGPECRELLLWDSKSKTLMKRLGQHEGKILSAAFDASGGRIASGSEDGAAMIWSVASHAKPIRLKIGNDPFEDAEENLKKDRLNKQLGILEKRNGNAIIGIEFLPGDANRIVTLNRKGVLRLWDIAQQRNIWAERKHEEESSTLAISPDGRTIATGGRLGRVTLSDADTGRTRQQIRMSDNQFVSSVAFHPNGKTFAMASSTNGIAIWDVETGEKRRDLGSDKLYNYLVMTFSADGRRLIVGSRDQILQLWDTTSWTPLVTIREQLSSGSIAILHDAINSRIVHVDKSGRVGYWEAPDVQTRKGP